MAEQLVIGFHAVKALLRSKYRKAQRLVINQDRVDQRIQDILQFAVLDDIPVEQISTQKMEQRFPNIVHQGVIAYTTPLPQYGEKDLPYLLNQVEKKPFLILMLDGITDPHNLGACLRSADALGADFVIIPKDKNAMITPVVSKVACGALESMPLVRVTNLVRAMETLKQDGIWIYGAAGEAKRPINGLDFKTSIALVLGAEEDGMRRLTREHCDDLFSIPMLGHVTSLNVSVAAGICLYEAVRQRQVSS